MSELDEMFDGLDEATVESKRPKLEEGSFILEVQATKQGKGYKSGPNFVIECTIVECLTPAIALKFPAGREISCTINRLTDRNEDNRALALGNLKAFLAAAFSDLDLSRLNPSATAGKRYFDPESKQEWKKLGMLCIKRTDLLTGCKVRVQVDAMQTKGDFTFLKHSWRAVTVPETAAA